MSRLEEIKRVNSKHIKQHYGTSAVPTEDFKWLIQRVEELEKEIEGRKKFELGTASNLKILREQNQQYRQSLEDIKRILDTYPHVDYSKSVTRRRLFDLANKALEQENDG